MPEVRGSVERDTLAADPILLQFDGSRLKALQLGGRPWDALHKLAAGSGAPGALGQQHL